MRELTVERYQSTRKKPGPRARWTASRRRAAMKDTGKIRDYVFAREQDICRCCRLRRAESMHELVFRSLGGKVSKKNSVALCGDGVQGCHGFLQRHEIAWSGNDDRRAEDLLQFAPRTQAAADWMRVEVGLWVASMPGGRNEEMEAC